MYFLLELIVQNVKLRKIYFASDQARSDALTYILNAQGFSDQLAQYQLQNELGGDGGDGSTTCKFYKAKHRISGATVDIKAIRTKSFKHSANRGRISESDALSLCKESSHVVSLLDVFENEKNTLLVTRFSAGGNLLSYLSDASDDSGRLSETRAHRIVSQVARGIKDIHAAGIVHFNL